MKLTKNIAFKLAFLGTIIIAFISCESINEKVLPSITGKSGDLLIVIDSAYWNHQTGKTLRETFTQEQKGLPQREALFNVIQVPQRSFARIFQTNRNILIVKIQPKEKTKINIRKDVWSKTQLVITITAPNDKTAAKTIQKNATTFIDYFNAKEIERLQSDFKVNATSKNANYLKEKLNLSINIDDAYVIAKDTSNLIWLRKEQNVGGHPVSRGIIIYTYPYDSDSIFNITKLTEKRNKITKQHVKGSAKKSYMLSYSEYTPNEREINLKGIYAKELRGLWQMQGEFMGGPYLSYSMVDEPRKRIITIDSYIYAPKFDKREFLRELEALALTITF